MALGNEPYSFSFLVTMSWVGIFLLLGVFLRALVPFLKRYLFPACMIGGFIGAVVFNLGLFDFLGENFRPNQKILEIAVFHIFNLSFICFGLSGFGTSKGATKTVLKNAIWLGCFSAAVGFLQYATATLTIAGYNVVSGNTLLESAGMLGQIGFVGGPGAALTIGAIFEQAGHANMIMLGLTFAALGYVSSIMIGIPITNYILRKKGLVRKGEFIPENEQRGYFEEGECPPAGSLKFLSSNIDTMAFQMALIVSAYFLAYVMCKSVFYFLTPQLSAVLWGAFPPLFCIPAGMIVRSLILGKIFKVPHLFDAGCHTRLLNIFVDFLAVAALLGIQLAVIREWIIPMVMCSITICLVTVIVLFNLTRYNKEFAAERCVTFLGAFTGTVTTGLVLARMIDPEYKSTVPFEVGLSALPLTIITTALMPFIMQYQYAQIFYGGSWVTTFVAMSILFAIFFGIAKLPFWNVNGKEAQF